GVYVLAYREDLLEQAGVAPPNSLAELLEAAEALTDVAAGLFGIGLPGQVHGQTFETYDMILRALGGSVFTEDRTASALDQPVAREALDYYIELSRYAPEEFVTWTQNEMVAAGQAGLVAMQMVFHHRLFAMNDP